MKALSIKQPWAWAICNLPEPFKKNIENRTWDTKHRGEFLVHAGKKLDINGYARMKYYLKQLNYQGVIPSPKDFVLGAIIGKATLVDTVKEHESIWFEGGLIDENIIGFELEYGVALKEPIEYKGQLNFFEIPDDLVKEKKFDPNGILKPLTQEQIENIYKKFEQNGIEKERVDLVLKKTPDFVCLGCGCTDSYACEDGCYWLAVDLKSGFGICSSCENELNSYGDY
jgi:hypothetical protein